MKKWQCVVCGLIYDEAEGWPDDGIAPAPASDAALASSVSSATGGRIGDHMQHPDFRARSFAARRASVSSLISASLRWTPTRY